MTVEDRFWYLACTSRWCARCNGCAEQIGRLQQGRISIYLLYSFVTLAALLVIVL